MTGASANADRAGRASPQAASRLDHSATIPCAKHPGKSAAQRRALDQIGCGNYSPIMAPKTRDAMLRDGLIVELPEAEVSFVGSLRMKVRQFEMPIPVHIRWCEAMSAECGDD